MTGFALQISAGVGPVEVRRFVSRLAARLEAVAEDRGLIVTDVACHGDGDDAPRSVTLHLAGDARGALVDELGTHVLIAASRGRGARKRWYAAVTLHPLPAMVAAPTSIARDDLVITACRAGGPGGQHVNKVSSAVRVHHVPSGLSVRSASERSQRANLDHALRRLGALLGARADAARADADRDRRLAHYRVERGRPVRSYVLDEDGALVERPGGGAA